MAWPIAKAVRRALVVSAATASVSLAVRAQAPEEAVASYQDHYLSNGTLAPNISYGEDGYSEEAGGLARSLRVDAVATAIYHHTGDASSDINESGVIVDSQWDTTSYGGWSLAGAAQTTRAADSDGNKVAIAIQQRALPVGSAWHVNNGVGTINSNNIDLLRTQQRFFLPTTPLLGASSEWLGPHNLQIVGSVGEPGFFQGVRVPGFQTEGGTTATVGAQWSPADAWALGGQLIDAHDVTSLSGFTTTTDQKQSSASALLTAAWHNPFSTAQLSLIDGSVSGTGGGSGAWLDANFSTGRMLQGAGLFHVDPNLSWGNQPIISDAQGGYYRNSYQSRRWQADLGVDYLDSISGRGASTTYYSGSARYQLSRDFGVGGVANVREASGAHGWSTAGYVDWRNRLGISRAQANYAEDSPRQEAALTLDQAWNVPQGTRLSTSLSVERLSGTSFEDHTALAVSVYGGGDLTARLSIDGNVRWARAVQGNNAPASSANVELIWQLSANWSMLATYYQSHTGTWNAVTVSSPLAPPDLITSPASEDQGVFFTVRYQRASGAHFAPLGGPPGTGWGPVSGTVYLDNNSNDLLDANETGAANVTVLLDGRYSARTDAQGRYEFPAVAAGRHVLIVVPDNLPLPWIIPGEGSIQILVETRKRTTRDIGARRNAGT